MRIFQSKLLSWTFLKSKINPRLKPRNIKVTVTAREKENIHEKSSKS